MRRVNPGNVRKKQLDSSVDLERMAGETHGFSGADLANLVTEFGMSEKLGLRTFSGDGSPDGPNFSQPRDYSEHLAKLIDEEVGRILKNAGNSAQSVIREGRPRLDHIAAKLLEVETLQGPELEAVFNEQIEK